MEINQPNPGSSYTPPPAGEQMPGNNSSHNDHTLMAVLAYLGILIIIPFLTEAKNNPFVKFHLKQGLVLFIAEIIASAFYRIPFFGWIFSPIIGLAILILVIIGIMNVLNKQMKELPVIGHMANKFNF